MKTLFIAFIAFIAITSNAQTYDANITLQFGDHINDIKASDKVTMRDIRRYTMKLYSPNGAYIATSKVSRISRINEIENYEYFIAKHDNTPMEFKMKADVWFKWGFWVWRRVYMLEEDTQPSGPILSDYNFHSVIVSDKYKNVLLDGIQGDIVNIDNIESYSYFFVKYQEGELNGMVSKMKVENGVLKYAEINN